MKPLIKILTILTLCLTSSFGLYPCGGDDDDEGCVYNSHYIGSDYAKNVKSIGNGFIIDLDTMKVYKFSINSISGGVHNDGDPMPPAGFYIINPYNPNLVVYYKSVTFSFVNNYWGIGALDIPSAEYKTQHYMLYTDCKNEKNSYFNTQTLSCMTCKENEIYNYETGKCEPKCGEGKYFDPELNECVPKGAVDCDIDENGNYIAPPGFTMYEKEKSYICEPDNCIAAIEPKDRYQCLCKSQGLGNFRNVITFKDYLFNLIKNGKIVAKNINVDELAEKYKLHTAIRCDNGGLAFNDITLEPINLDMFDITNPEPKPSEPFKPEPKPNPKPDKPVSPSPDPAKPNPKPSPDKPSPNPTNPGNGSNTPNPNPSNGDISDNNNTTPGKNGGNNKSTETKNKDNKDDSNSSKDKDNNKKDNSNSNSSDNTDLSTIEELLRQIEKNTKKDINGTDLSGIEGLLKGIKDELNSTGKSDFNGTIDFGNASDIDVDGGLDKLGSVIDDSLSDVEDIIKKMNDKVSEDLGKAEKQFNEAMDELKRIADIIKNNKFGSIGFDSSIDSCPRSGLLEISNNYKREIIYDPCKFVFPLNTLFYVITYVSLLVFAVIGIFKIISKA